MLYNMKWKQAEDFWLYKTNMHIFKKYLKIARGQIIAIIII